MPLDADVAREVQRLMKEHAIPGVSVAIVRDYRLAQVRVNEPEARFIWHRRPQDDSHDLETGVGNDTTGIGVAAASIAWAVRAVARL